MDVQVLHKFVDAVTVMTYDASRPDRPGFNAPLPWVESNIKLLLDPEHAAARKPKGDGDEEPKACDPGPDLVSPSTYVCLYYHCT